MAIFNSHVSLPEGIDLFNGSKRFERAVRDLGPRSLDLLMSRLFICWLTRAYTFVDSRVSVAYPLADSCWLTCKAVAHFLLLMDAHRASGSHATQDPERN